MPTTCSSSGAYVRSETGQQVHFAEWHQQAGHQQGGLQAPTKKGCLGNSETPCLGKFQIAFLNESELANRFTVLWIAQLANNLAVQVF